jgi:hypothetical protein
LGNVLRVLSTVLKVACMNAVIEGVVALFENALQARGRTCWRCWIPGQ